MSKIWVFCEKKQPVCAFTRFEDCVKYYVENHVKPQHSSYQQYWDEPSEEFVYNFYRPYIENRLDHKSMHQGR